MLSLETKSQIIKKHQRSAVDTGSSSVQIALLTERINGLNKHLQANRQDFSTKAGLIKLVGKRRSLLAYLERSNEEEYKRLVNTLGLRG